MNRLRIGGIALAVGVGLGLSVHCNPAAEGKGGWQLTPSIQGMGTLIGKINGAPVGSTCAPAPGATSVQCPVLEADDRVEIELDAQPADGWSIQGWAGTAAGCKGAGSSVQLGAQFGDVFTGAGASVDVTCKVTFVQNAASLEVEIVGIGSVAVAEEGGPGIATCQAPGTYCTPPGTPQTCSYGYGGMVTLTAEDDPASGFTFAHWSQQCGTPGGTSRTTSVVAMEIDGVGVACET